MVEAGGPDRGQGNDRSFRGFHPVINVGETDVASDRLEPERPFDLIPGRQEPLIPLPGESLDPDLVLGDQDILSERFDPPVLGELLAPS
jgi:hypothetical protein